MLTIFDQRVTHINSECSSNTPNERFMVNGSYIGYGDNNWYGTVNGNGSGTERPKYEFMPIEPTDDRLC